MHEWGDEWFKQYGDELYTAIREIERRLRRFKIGISGKEKWGCYRDEYLTFWDGGLYQILFGYRAYIGTFRRKGLYRLKWFKDLVNRFHNYVCYTVDPKFKKLTAKKNIHGRIVDWQKRKLNDVFQTVCMKHPDIIDELVCDVDCYELIKPNKKGNVSGTAIHNKHWKSL